VIRPIHRIVQPRRHRRGGLGRRGTRESLVNIVERSITAERLIAELERVFAVAGGPPKVLRMDNGPESHFSSAAIVLRWEGGAVLHST
jgi:hypothetical protein